MKEKRQNGRRVWACAATASLLLNGAHADAGTITCNDQVGMLKAELTRHPDATAQEQLDDAARLCREYKDADALVLIGQVRAAIAGQQPGAAASPDTAQPSPR